MEGIIDVRLIVLMVGLYCGLRLLHMVFIKPFKKNKKDDGIKRYNDDDDIDNMGAMC